MGRPNGSTTRNTQFLNNRLKQMMGDDFEPMVKAAENAVRMQAIADESREALESDELDIESKIAAKSNEFNQRKECVVAWEKIGQYCSPKLKAIEVSGEVKSALSFVLDDIQEGNDGLPEE